ncbi:protease SohB [Paraferrimonas sp. SM1919]|uniref:protease SohB n=1 Tax=Paraferrimonas sp. SM1919 TaxID=2662263 RepID=UPI0013D5D8CA|nr:protease SohB [Paraferrimonas sp. SM1919]
MEFLFEYGLFLAKAVTLVVAVILVLTAMVAISHKPKSEKGELILTDISDNFKSLVDSLKEQLLDKKQLKQLKKQQKKSEKQEKDQDQEALAKTFYLKFKGSIDAKEVESLRREVTAVLAIAEAGDEVLVSIESGGGMVHGYGLAASQLDRIKQAGLTLTVCVDKVAASGGYMMACVADKIYSAPFAIIGSIGVVAQLPNFNRLLKKHDIDYEQHTAGDFKRTLTVFGENTDEGREKFQQELEETHVLFKEYVGKYRPALDIEKVATGEHWYGQQAIELGLIDAIKTSDDVLFELAQNGQVYKVEYKLKQNLAKKFAGGASALVTSVIDAVAAKAQKH